jgi:kumamolisin
MQLNSEKASHSTILPRSERSLPIGVQTIGPVNSGEMISVSVILKSLKELDLNQLHGARLSSGDYAKMYGADPVAANLVRQFATTCGLTVDEKASSPIRRTIVLRGTASSMQRAFGCELKRYEFRDRDGFTQGFRGREGAITIPSNLIGNVEAILGLDNRPQASAHFRRVGAVGAHAAMVMHTENSNTAVQVAQLYNFPTDTTGTGQTIGIIELGGGYQTKDLERYFTLLGRKAPSIVAISVDGAIINTTDSNGPDAEVMLDVEIAAAIAPDAKIVMYFGPNTDRGFQDALTTAVHDTTNKPNVISISWGSSESTWTEQAMIAFDNACQSAAALGITVAVASGDNGSADGISDNANHVDFPASSPHVLACGGTTLKVSDGVLKEETVWNDLPHGGATGGGVSSIFAKPDYQKGANVPAPTNGSGGRGVPDVSGGADPRTGYQIQVDGESEVVGGTSAVAPLWAGLVALLNQKLGQPVGFINPKLYAGASTGITRDITKGNNGAFSASQGWDPCTGLGSPNGMQLEAALMK